MFWKVSKVHWIALAWLKMLSLATIQFTRYKGTVRLIFKNYDVRFEERLQIKFEDEKQVFSFKIAYQYAQEAFLLSAVCCFYIWNNEAHLQWPNC